MAAQHLTQQQIDAIAAHGRDLLRKERAAKAPETVNLIHALALGQSIPLPWDGTEYRVKTISYREGLELNRASMALDRWAKQGPKNEEELEDCEADLIETLVLFHSLLDPKPEANPFMDASPAEVGSLLAFFSMCQTMQQDRSRISLPRASTIN